MRTFTPSTWGKMLLAGVAVLIVGGPGFVLADGGPSTDYITPRSARLLGPGTVANNSFTPYTLQVFFQDGSSCLFVTPDAVFSQTGSSGGGNGSFSGNTYHATSTGFVVLKGQYTNTVGTVESTRRIRIQ